MFELVATEEFIERYASLPLAVQKKLEKQEKFFRENPWHPSLHAEKLVPKTREVWSFRVDRSYRVLFRFLSGRRVLLLTVGRHDWVYRI